MRWDEAHASMIYPSLELQDDDDERCNTDNALYIYMIIFLSNDFHWWAHKIVLSKQDLRVLSLDCTNHDSRLSYALITNDIVNKQTIVLSCDVFIGGIWV